MKVSSTPHRANSAKFILTGLIAATASLALPCSSHAQVSAFDFTLDGQFTDGFNAAGPIGEWSDVTPFSFISSPTDTVPTTNNDPLRNTQLYAAISHNVASPVGDLQLHLMYDFLPRTLLPQSGEVFATVTFPVTLENRPKDNISVIFQGAQEPSIVNTGIATSFFDIFVDLDTNDPDSTLFPLNPTQFPGLLGAASFGPSPLGSSSHLRVELEVPLRIPAGFATPPPTGTGLPGNGINPTTGMYDPAPVFWGAAAAGNEGPLDSVTEKDGGDSDKVALAPPLGFLQPATSALIGINSDGSLTVTPTPEPSTAVLLLGGLAMLGARRRRSVGAA